MPGEAKGISSSQFLSSPIFLLLLLLLSPIYSWTFNQLWVNIGPPCEWVHPVGGSTSWAGPFCGWVHPTLGGPGQWGTQPFGGPCPWGDPTQLPFWFKVAFKDLIFSIYQKIQRGDPSMSKKIFVSDFDKTQNLKSLWPRDSTHEIWVESETKMFLT